MTFYDDMLNAGKYHALGLALEALVQKAVDREQAVTTTLNAIEAEIARELHKRDKPQAWIDGLLDAQSELRRHFGRSDT